MFRLLLAAGLCGMAALSVQAQEFPTAEPTPEHKILLKDVGEWDATMTMYTGGPDAEPIVMPAKETNKVMDGGMWVLSTYDAGAFKGFGQFGYDPIKKKYIGTWIDSTSPYMSMMEGDYDKEKRELTMFMTGVDAMTKQAFKMKSVSKEVNKDKRVFTMYANDPETKKWTRAFVIEYNRKK